MNSRCVRCSRSKNATRTDGRSDGGLRFYLRLNWIFVYAREWLAESCCVCIWYRRASSSPSSFIYRSTHYGFLIRWLSLDRRSKMGRRGSESKPKHERRMRKGSWTVVFHEKLVLVLFMVLTCQLLVKVDHRGLLRSISSGRRNPGDAMQRELRERRRPTVE